MWNGNERKLRHQGRRRRIRNYNVIGRNKLFGGRIGKPKVAICPKCGEVSIYVEDVEKL